MAKKILITRPNHDITTNYLCFWTEPVITLVKNKGLTFYDLLGPKASRKNFVSYLENTPDFVFINGHGSENLITGDKNEIILDKENVSFTSKIKIVYARSCQAAKILGELLIKNGVLTFIGYTKNFVFLREKSKISHPLDDRFAKLFLEPSNLVATTIIKGHNVLEAQNRSLMAMRKNLDHLLSSNATFEEKNATPYLWSNMNCQVLIGGKGTKL